MLTVVYIEDNVTNAQLMERIMAMRSTVRLLLAERGQTGLDLIEAERPGLILLDANLPDMLGEDIVSVLARSDAVANIPVIVVSADASPQRIERLLQLGAHQYLTKPLNVTDLLKLIDDQTADTDTPHEKPLSPRDEPGAGATVLDPTCVAELRWIDTESGGIADLIRLFAEDGAARVDQMRAALSRADLSELTRVAHQLHGSAGSFCAVELANTCRAVEEAAKSPERVVELQQLIAHADAGLLAAVTELSQRMAP